MTYSEQSQPFTLNKPVLIVFYAFAAYMSFSTIADVAKPAMDAQKTPETAAVYELGKQNVDLNKIAMAYLDNRAKFEPYRAACKAATTQVIIENCGKIAFQLNN